MATALDVMRYIKSRHAPSGDVQLQKLVYYSQAWTLAWDGVPLFPERIEAWRLGPVVPAIWRRDDGPASDGLTEAEKANVDAVIGHYGQSYGVASKKQAEVAAIKDWQGFTAFEYGGSWSNFALAGSRGIKCEQGPSGWGCNVEARPCKAGGGGPAAKAKKKG